MEERRTIPTIRNDARKLARELLQLEENADEIKDVIKLLHRMELLPMASILERVPGETVTDKAHRVGISRQTYYYWLQGRSRPSLEVAERLAKLTGIPLRSIRTEEI